MNLPVNEIFQTLQGEATWTGAPSVFVRLQGCAVGCPWCDTKHTWALDVSKETTQADIIAKQTDSASWAVFPPRELAMIVSRYPSRHVVITGGEPCDYDLTELTALLEFYGKSVQVETSGTAEIRVSPGTWVTCSPKIGMPGGLEVLAKSLFRANEIKMPVGKIADLTKVRQALTMARRDVTVWLQPLSQSPKATALCVHLATKNGWRVSIQTHKFLGLR